MGRQFDGDGRLVNWWSNATTAKFDDKAQCFIDQYSNFTVIGEDGEPIHLNGKLTLGENLADNGGLSESYYAWKQRYDSDRESKVYNNVRLPGLEEFSLEQMFFINFGRIWCDKLTLAQYKKQVNYIESSIITNVFIYFLGFFRSSPMSTPRADGAPMALFKTLVLLLKPSVVLLEVP